MIRKMKLARIGLWSAVKIGFFLSAAAGFLLGLFGSFVLALFSSLIAMAVHSRQPGMGPGAVIVLPMITAIFCGFIGTVISFIGALAYNLAAGMSGGLEVEAELRDEPARRVETSVPLTATEPPPVAAVTDMLPIHRRTSFLAHSERPRSLGLRKARMKSF